MAKCIENNKNFVKLWHGVFDVYFVYLYQCKSRKTAKIGGKINGKFIFNKRL